MPIRTMARPNDLEAKVAEALEPAPPVWPPPVRDRTPVGEAEAARYLKGRVAYESGESLAGQTARPAPYTEEAVGPRLVRALARLPRDLFDILSSGRREVRFHVQPPLSRSSSPIAEARPSGPGGARSYVVLLRGAVELEDDAVFLAIVVHELCHIILDHPAPIAWPRDPREKRKATARMENEALKLADEIGFREETWVLKDLLLDMAEERQQGDLIMPDGSMREPR